MKSDPYEGWAHSDYRDEIAMLNASLARSESARRKAEADLGDALAAASIHSKEHRLALDALASERAAREKAERERDAYRHEWNVSSRQQGAETRARKAAEARAARAESLLTDDGPDGQRVTNAQHVALRERLARAEAALRETQERLDRIDAFAGERCEASGCRPDPCGPVEYHDVEGVPLCAECWQECVEEAALAGQEVGR